MMIDTLKRFWKQNWHRILCACAVLLVVCSIAFSCGVNAMAYEADDITLEYLPSYLLVDGEGENDINAIYPALYQTYDNEPPELIYNSYLDANYDDYSVMTEYLEVPNMIPTSSPILTEGLCLFTSVPLPLAYQDLNSIIFSCSYPDYTPYIPDNAPTINKAYLSPYSYVFLGIVMPSPDDTPYLWFDVEVDYYRITGESSNTLKRSSVVHLPDLLNGGRPLSLYDIIDYTFQDELSDMVITSVRLNLTHIWALSEVSDSDTTNQQITLGVYNCPYNSSARRSAFDTATLYYAEQRGYIPSYSDDVDEAYKEGYIHGKNSALTEDFGVVDWLVKAGDSFMNFQLFKVGTTSVSVGTLFSVIIGTFLLFFILRIFAGG